jgi:anti-anti-sigma factor
MSMLPPPQMKLDGIECEWLFVPSSYLSGDMLNVIVVDDVHVNFYSIDVAGHGVQAALLSVIVSRLLALGAEGQNMSGQFSPAIVVREMNRQFLAEATDTPHFTMVYGSLDTQTGEGVLTQAGHTHPMLLTAGGDVCQLGAGGFPVGLLADCEYDTVRFVIRPTDRLFLYSDGVTECMDPVGEQFGETRLRNFLSEHAHLSLREALDALKLTLLAWRGKNPDTFDDDVSVLALERLAGRANHVLSERRTEENMLTEMTSSGDIRVLKVLPSRFDASVAPKIRDELIALARQGVFKVVLDLQCVQFIDSSGLGAMVSGFKALGSSGELVLCGVEVGVHNMLKLTRMDRVFVVVSDTEEACARLA